MKEIVDIWQRKMLTLEQISKDIHFLKTCKPYKNSLNVFILYDKETRARRRYIKQNNEWVFCGVFSLEEVARLYKDARNA